MDSGKLAAAFALIASILCLIFVSAAVGAAMWVVYHVPLQPGGAVVDYSLGVLKYCTDGNSDCEKYECNSDDMTDHATDMCRDLNTTTAMFGVCILICVALITLSGMHVSTWFFP